MLTERDLKALEFISKCPCKSDVVQKLFYPSYSVTMYRLRAMIADGYIKRYRGGVGEKYFYYTGKRPKQIEHMNMVAMCYLWIKSKGYEVLNFKREVKLGEVKPDAIIGIEKNGEYGVLMIEIERFNNTLVKKISSYEKIYKDKRYFNTFKVLYVCGKEVRSSVVDVINVKPNVFIELN
ncbi:hypothetical protein [Cellulosilyticum sp. I15G10I2]|uniref:hypothetical protein n=1 Tax=Cellulosilyticum sp. I15G10I2 TaxID=1892843 RepID=UPI00085C1866|nr:hypothetical protein [Cellulosilyticum sp. I15G10I2]